MKAAAGGGPGAEEAGQVLLELTDRGEKQSVLRLVVARYYQARWSSITRPRAAWRESLLLSLSDRRRVRSSSER